MTYDEASKAWAVKRLMQSKHRVMNGWYATERPPMTEVPDVASVTFDCGIDGYYESSGYFVSTSADITLTTGERLSIELHDDFEDLLRELIEGT